MHLRTSPTPPTFATREQHAWDAAFYAQREPYRLKTVGSVRRDDGGLTMYCNASALAGWAVKCENKPASLNVDRAGGLRVEVGTALPVIVETRKPAICTSEKLTVPFAQLPFWQPHIPGTAAHQWSTNRRNNVEGAFARIKDEATQSLRRGQVRLMGIARNTFAYLLYAMAANLAEVTRWRARQAGAVDLQAKRAEKKRRTPRAHIMKRVEEGAKREEARALKAEAAATAVVEDLDPPPIE